MKNKIKKFLVKGNIYNQDNRQNAGITLIALVITIIILIIIAGISINMIFSNNGLFNKTNQAKEEHQKQTATEIMNLKITNIQISSYTESQQLPNLQYVSDKLCEDNDMEYVILKEKEQASLEKITVGSTDSILTKLKEYPYVFEINNQLQLASIDGVKVATVPTNDHDTIVSMTLEELKELISNEVTSQLENITENSGNSIPTLDWSSKTNITNNLKTVGSSYTSTSNGIIRIFLDQNNTSDCCLNLSVTGTSKKYYANSKTSWVTFTDEFRINKSDTITVASDSILSGFRTFYIEFVPYK